MEILLQFIYGAIMDLPPGANAGYLNCIFFSIPQNKYYFFFFFFPLFVSQSGGFSGRYAWFGWAQRCGGDGSDQRLLPFLPQGPKDYQQKLIV